MHDEIIEALESTAVTPDGRFKPANASVVSIKNHRDYLLRFLIELDASITVGEIREALEDY